jgi:hypothetical protein
VQANGESGEYRRAVVLGIAVERIAYVLEARLHCHPVSWQQRALCRAAGQILESGQPMIGRELADRVHAGMKVERRQPVSAVTNLCDASADLCPDVRERIRRHKSPYPTGRLSHFR